MALKKREFTPESGTVDTYAISPIRRERQLFKKPGWGTTEIEREGGRKDAVIYEKGG